MKRDTWALVLSCDSGLAAGSGVWMQQDWKTGDKVMGEEHTKGPQSVWISVSYMNAHQRDFYHRIRVLSNQLDRIT